MTGATRKYSRALSVARSREPTVRFAQVTGVLHSDRNGFRIVVTLDDTTSVLTIRDEFVPSLLTQRGTPNAGWTVDQLTQETIGTTLAEQGWEVVAMQPQPETDEWSLPLASYLVRR